MSEKRRTPKVKLSSQTIISAMLSPTRNGVVDRNYLKSMAVAVDSYNRHKNATMKKIVRETSSED